MKRFLIGLLLPSLVFSDNIFFSDPSKDQAIESSVLTYTGDKKNEILSTTVLLFRNQRKIAHGCIVDSQGFVLTKASTCVGTRYIRTSTGESHEVRIRKRDHATDLALLQIMDKKNWPSVTWDTLPESSSEGSWVASADARLSEIDLGIISGTHRKISREGGVMGVMLGPPEKGQSGVPVIEIIPHAAADRAGLQTHDIILLVDGTPATSPKMVNNIIISKDPGDLLLLKIKRRSQIIHSRVTLGHKSVTFDLFNRNLLMSGSVSKRKDDFPLIIQHDLPLEQTSVGGGLFGLNGLCLGINIAKVDRVMNYSIPASIVKPLVEQWMKEILEKSNGPEIQ